MSNEIKIVYETLDKLIPNEYNPKKMTQLEADHIENSIKEFGVVDPIIANSSPKRKGRIIGGHQRFQVCKRMKMVTVPVVWLDIPDIKKEQELCLRLSKNTGSFDFDLLANIDSELLNLVGFESQELDRIFDINNQEDDFNGEKEHASIKESKVKRRSVCRVFNRLRGQNERGSKSRGIVLHLHRIQFIRSVSIFFKSQRRDILTWRSQNNVWR
jgi:hypothetical protein